MNPIRLASRSSALALLAVTPLIPSPAAAGSPPTWFIGEPGYVVEVVAEDLQLPVNIAFVPEPESALDAPFFYVSELRGTIKVVSRTGEVSDYATGVLNYVPPDGIPGTGEQGLTGIAVHPATGDVYATMLYEQGGSTYPRIVRLTSSDGGRTADSQTTILEMPGETMGQAHMISTVTFGPDGKLYVHVGDGFHPATAQNLDAYRGKILRMNLDGSAPGDNPFYDAGDGIGARDYVFASGFRNPFGGDWRAADGKLYEVENGTSIDRFAQVNAGADYGWNGQTDSLMTLALHIWGPQTAPVNIAFVQPETFGGSGFPIGKMDRGYVSLAGPTYGWGVPPNGKKIVEFELDTNGEVIGGPDVIVEYAGFFKASVVALEAGPDGLYFSDFYKDQGASSAIERGANILRLRWVDAPRLELTVGPALLSWDDLPGIAGYDIVRGSIALLHASGGDFGQATTDCLDDNRAATSLPETAVPASGAAYWYLVRDVTPNDTGSYESGGTRQLGLRDAEIASSADSCP